MPKGPGVMLVTLGNGWVPQKLNLLDNGTRFVIQLKNDRLALEASYILFPNNTGAPTATSCRDAVIHPVLTNPRSDATVSPEQQSTRKMSDGRALAISSYRIERATSTDIQQENLFGFLGDANTCAEVHVSKVNFKPADKLQMNAVLDAFSFDPTYTPAAADYGVIGTLFFNYFRDYKASAIYYRRTLDTLPPTELAAPASLIARVTVDQLSMSYGMSGDLADSRAINEAAIKRDPTYPLYYYNLACADAESGDAASARTHLQQAFDRRANTLKDEPFPDPTKDESILKLQNDKAFWAFVQSLPKS